MTRNGRQSLCPSAALHHRLLLRRIVSFHLLHLRRLNPLQRLYRFTLPNPFHRHLCLHPHALNNMYPHQLPCNRPQHHRIRSSAWLRYRRNLKPLPSSPPYRHPYRRRCEHLQRRLSRVLFRPLYSRHPPQDDRLTLRIQRLVRPALALVDRIHPRHEMQHRAVLVHPALHVLLRRRLPTSCTRSSVRLARARSGKCTRRRTHTTGCMSRLSGYGWSRRRTGSLLLRCARSSCCSTSVATGTSHACTTWISHDRTTSTRPTCTRVSEVFWNTISKRDVC